MAACSTGRRTVFESQLSWLIEVTMLRRRRRRQRSFQVFDERDAGGEGHQFKEMMDCRAGLSRSPLVARYQHVLSTPAPHRLGAAGASSSCATVLPYFVRRYSTGTCTDRMCTTTRPKLGDWKRRGAREMEERTKKRNKAIDMPLMVAPLLLRRCIRVG